MIHAEAGGRLVAGPLGKGLREVCRKAVMRSRISQRRWVILFRMRWGKVFDIDANEDSQLVAASLKIWAAYGVNEALTDPF